MLAKSRGPAFRLGLPLLVLMALLLVMVPSASATASMTCVTTGGEETPHIMGLVRRAGPNTFFTETFTAHLVTTCGEGVNRLENRFTVFSNGDFHARGFGTYTGSIRDASGTLRSGTFDFNVVVNGSPAKTGIIAVKFTIVGGTGGLANIHGQISQVIDLNPANPPCCPGVLEYHFDPQP